ADARWFAIRLVLRASDTDEYFPELRGSSDFRRGDRIAHRIGGEMRDDLMAMRSSYHRRRWFQHEPRRSPLRTGLRRLVWLVNASRQGAGWLDSSSGACWPPVLRSWHWGGGAAPCPSPGHDIGGARSCARPLGAPLARRRNLYGRRGWLTAFNGRAG